MTTSVRLPRNSPANAYSDKVSGYALITRLSKHTRNLRGIFTLS
ncbi:Uncharacterised protein [Vibrio cholerae]|nr:Uncharacterised protein [Vibrio cholerae]